MRKLYMKKIHFLKILKTSIFIIGMIFNVQYSLSMEKPKYAENTEERRRQKTIIELIKPFFPDVTVAQLEAFDNKYLVNQALPRFIEKKDGVIQGKKFNRMEAIETMLAFGADPTNALEHAILNNDLQVARKAIDKKADVNDMIDSHTMLTMAIKSAKGLKPGGEDEKSIIGIVELLIKSGADVRKTDKKGNTPIQWARDSITPEIIGLLYNAGIKPMEADIPIKR